MSYQLTVITPVYNIAAYLPRYFDSMCRQTYRDFCLLLLDDGSADETLQLCRAFAEKNSWVRVIASEHLGITAIRNMALGYVETPFTAYADGDDYVEPDYLKHLMDAREKYDADLAVSRVQYMLESGAVEGEFPARGETLIKRGDFAQRVPMLLDDRRLNYLYGKVYRSSLLQDIRIPEDVRQGSDTMTNFEFLRRASSVVLTDDLDYHYIRYSTRSVTSYSGEGAFSRINRINRRVYDCSEQMGILTDDMLGVIDSRVLQSAGWVIEKILASGRDDAEKARQISEILSDDFYLAAFDRQKRRRTSLPFEVIEPQDGAEYMKKRRQFKEKQNKKAKILKSTPDFIVNIYHKIKGTSAED